MHTWEEVTLVPIPEMMPEEHGGLAISEEVTISDWSKSYREVTAALTESMEPQYTLVDTDVVSLDTQDKADG